jgi:hypothetical protein
MKNTFSRRSILKATAVTGGVLFAPNILFAQDQLPYVRKNVADPAAAADLEAYKLGVQAMLNLPPDHPHNWYRNAFVHLMDCPHGNWWFTAWHRGFTGYFEETIRKLSGKDNFALPYWDWTAEPSFPQSLFGADNPLDLVNYRPSGGSGNNGYIADLATFESTMKAPMRAYWDNLTPSQREQEARRGGPHHYYKTFDDMWAAAEGAFSKQSVARFLTSAAPHLDAGTSAAVSETTLVASILPKLFAIADGTTADVAFNSAVTENHHIISNNFSTLEGQPHNLVHNNVGGVQTGHVGFMTEFLSPVDPIFFLHHGNIDRIWDIWTRKQINIGGETKPNKELMPDFAAERFEFFINAGGETVTDKTHASDYLDIGSFNYVYTPGSGSYLADKTALIAKASDIGTSVSAKVTQNTIALGSAGISAIALPQSVVDHVTSPSDVTAQVAIVTLVPPKNNAGKSIDVFVHPVGEAPNLDPAGDEFAGSFEFFGQRHSASGPITINIGISDALDKLLAAGKITIDQEVGISVAIGNKDGGVSKAIDATLLDISIRTL